jgi:hypothetical protein
LQGFYGSIIDKKGKILSVFYHHALKMYERMEAWLHVLNLGTRLRLVDIIFGCFTSGKRVTDIYWMGSSVGTSGSLEVLTKRKIPASDRTSLFSQ